MVTSEKKIYFLFFESLINTDLRRKASLSSNFSLYTLGSPTVNKICQILEINDFTMNSVPLLRRAAEIGLKFSQVFKALCVAALSQHW